MLNVIITGSKEFPFGTNHGDDPIPSGGMETYVNDIVPQLSGKCSVTVVTRRFSGAPVDEKAANIRIRRVRWLHGKWLRNPSFNVFSALETARLMGRADIVYSNGIVAGVFGLLLARAFHRKCVYRPAGTAYLQQKSILRGLLFFVEKAVMKKSDAVIFHSDGEMSNARLNFGIGLRNGRVILTGFPVEKFASAARPQKGGGMVTGTVARFVPVKGLDVLLEAFSFGGGNGKLLLVGAGPEDTRLRDLSRKLGVSERVVFTGFRHDVPQVLAGIDIFVISSFSEGLPTSLLEAMASGCACVVTDIGLPVQHMKTGLVVRPGDSKALSDALKKLSEDSALRKRLGEAARKFTLENCTQELAAEKHMEVFREITGSC